MLMTAIFVAQFAMPLDPVEEVSLALTEPMEVMLDPQTLNPESGVVRSEPLVFSDGVTLQIQVGTRTLDPAQLYSGPIVLFFDEAHAWDGSTFDETTVLYPDAHAIAEHLRRPDLAVLCGDRQLQTNIPSSLGVPIAIAVAVAGGEFGDIQASEEPEEECPIEIVEDGPHSWHTECDPKPCDLGGGAKGICGPTVLSQCMCARPPDDEDDADEPDGDPEEDGGDEVPDPSAIPEGEEDEFLRWWMEFPDWWR